MEQQIKENDYIHKITSTVSCNYLFKSLNTQINKPNNQNLIKDPKTLKDQCNKQLCLNYQLGYKISANSVRNIDTAKSL